MNKNKQKQRQYDNMLRLLNVLIKLAQLFVS